MNKIRNSTSALVGLLALAALVVGLASLPARKPREEELPFETITQGDFINYREEAPALLVIAKGEDVDVLASNVLTEDPALVEQLRQLDYSRSFAILVLQGRKGSSGYSVTVQRIARAGGRVNVQAEFVEPDQDSRRTWVFTSPYHLVAISKEGDWGQQIRFVLVVNDELVAETTHVIP